MSVLKGNKLKDKFITLPNEVIVAQISHGAFRVFCYISSKPEGWLVRNTDIKKQLRIGQNQTLANYFKELLDAGWINREPCKDDGGKLSGGFDYWIMDKPQLGKSLNGINTESGENHTHINNNLFSNTKGDSNTEVVGDIKNGKKKFKPPTKEEVIEFFKEKGYNRESAIKMFDGYDVADWRDSRGNQVKSWKQKAIHVWFKPENKVKGTDNVAFDETNY